MLYFFPEEKAKSKGLRLQQGVMGSRFKGELSMAFYLVDIGMGNSGRKNRNCSHLYGPNLELRALATKGPT